MEGPPSKKSTSDLYLGFDISTQQLKVIAIGDDLEVYTEQCIEYDSDLKEFNTSGGLHAGSDGVSYTAPPAMWVKAFDLLLAKLQENGFPFARVVSISGCGQQHGSVYWGRGALQALRSLDPTKTLGEQLSYQFSIAGSPVWKDASTTAQCRGLEEAVGGAEVLAKITGSRAYERFTGNQIAKIHQMQRSIPEYAHFNQTERISLVSSFGATLLLGNYASIDYSDGSGMNLLDIQSKDWSQVTLDYCAPNLRSMLGPAVPGCSILGPVSDYYVQRYGFRADCKICTFTGDNPAALAGMRLQKGDIAFSLGTSDTLFLWLDEPRPQLVGHVLINPVASDAYMALLCYKNGSLTRQWVRDQYAQGSWETFDEMLRKTPAGNGGKIGFYFTDTEIIPVGIKGYYRFNEKDEKVAGFTPEEEVRAVVEGQLMAKLCHAQHLGYSVGPDTRILVTGGASENKTILQVLADVFGAPVCTLKGTKNATCLGCAFIAKHAYQSGSGGGRFSDTVSSASQNLLCVEPSLGAHQVYRRLLTRLQKLENEIATQ